jgi:hypothetical protein
MNDLDPLLHDAMARVRGPVDARPSVTDVRRRARRHNRRRMTATVGAVACAGVATAAVIIHRDAVAPSVAGDADSTAVAGFPTTTISGVFLGGTSTFPTTTLEPAKVVLDATFVWNALANLQSDPSAVGFSSLLTDVDRSQMPTAEMFGCTTDACVCMFNYVVWHELARVLGFFDMQPMQEYNRAIDFSQLPHDGDVLLTPSFFSVPPQTVNGETTTSTISVYESIVLIDGGAPAGAMEDAYQRLSSYSRSIVPSIGKTVEHTMVMPVGDNSAFAVAVANVFGIDQLDPWDPTLIDTPIDGMVAIVIGPDYFDRIGSAVTPAGGTGSVTPTTAPPIVAPTSTSIG